MLSNYIITEDGKVFSKLKNRYLKGLLRSDGYHAVFLLLDDNTSRWYYVHRLVATQFIPNPDNKPDVDHRDNNRSNNHKDNLQWVTEKENITLSFERGRPVRRGKDHHNFGKKWSKEARDKQSEAKKGENHPKFKGYYTYNGITSTSKRDLAIKLGTYNAQIDKLLATGEVQFTSKLMPKPKILLAKIRC